MNEYDGQLVKTEADHLTHCYISAHQDPPDLPSRILSSKIQHPTNIQQKKQPSTSNKHTSPSDFSDFRY